jgi:hypothetical protein
MYPIIASEKHITYPYDGIFELSPKIASRISVIGTTVGFM